MNLILSPHLDDAALSLGGLLAQEGSDSVVATFFAGAPETPLQCRWDKKCGFSDSTEAIQERIEENRKSLRLLGIADDRIRNYPHLDIEYRLAQTQSHTDDAELQNMLQQEMQSLLKEFASPSLKIFMPGLELHADHALVKNAALAVARTYTKSGTHQFFLYQDIPYVFNVLEKEHSRFWNILSRRNPRWWNYSLLTNKIAHNDFTISANTLPLSRADLEKKLAAIALYKSQVDHLGTDLIGKTEKSAAAQARSLSLTAPYCEVTYALTQTI